MWKRTASPGFDREVLSREGAFGVGGRDDLALTESADAADGGHVEQQSAGDDLRQSIRTTATGTPRLGHVVDPMAVVHAAVDMEVIEPVQMGAHLGGSHDLLDHPADPVSADRADRCTEFLTE